LQIFSVLSLSFFCFLNLPIFDPGGPSVRLYSGPGSDSGVNEGLVSLSNLDASFQFRSRFSLLRFWGVIPSFRLSEHGGSGLAHAVN